MRNIILSTLAKIQAEGEALDEAATLGGKDMATLLGHFAAMIEP